MAHKFPTTPQPTKAEKFRASLIFFIVGCFILYLFSAFLEFLFSPLKRLSRKEVSDRIDQKIQEKRDNRWEKRSKSLHGDDPMEQFYLRFVEKPKEYKKDPDNDIFYAWFGEWKKGNVIDSDLKWAPDILDERGEIRPHFIKYMKIQWKLHKKASLLSRMLFTNTIFKFYPELSASMKGLEEDLAQYEREADEEAIESELKTVMTDFGLPKGLVEYLAKKDISAKTLRKEAAILKDSSDKGFDPDVCICALENKLTHENALKVLEIVISKMHLPDKVAMSYLNKEMTSEQLTDIGKFMQETCAEWGHSIFQTTSSGLTHYDEFIDVKLKGYREKKVLRHLNRKKAK